jgi:glycerol-3-phosphate acyltransferase PlsX
VTEVSRTAPGAAERARTIRVAVDVMGGDHAPREPLFGAIAALEDEASLEVALVGDEAAIRAGLAGGRLPGRARIVHAPGRIAMDEHPVEALRKKGRNSISEALALLCAGEVDAFFSAGNTGACVAAAAMALRKIEGVRRPGIAVAFPTPRGATVLMDAGANLHAKPLDLVQYAAMASAYAREVFGVAEPTIGALNIGAEEAKGGAFVQETKRLLRQVFGPRFCGFVEGHDIFRGATDVVVCEAFVGNAVLKVAEGVAEAVLRRALGAVDLALGGSPERGRALAAIEDLSQRCDYADCGGAPLLGVEGVVVIGHGRSEARAIRNGVRTAARLATVELSRRMAEAVSGLPALS